MSLAGAALPTSPAPAFNFKIDENGRDDQPGQKDLSSHAVATPAPGELWAAWQWDDTSLSGGNTGDACALFDTDDNFNVDFAVCATIAGKPAALSATSVYTCGDTKSDRCTSTYAQLMPPIDTACATTTTATDPFHNGQKDTQAVCNIDLDEVGGFGTASLVNTCSYPSREPTSAPSDCVLIPRDAFIKIEKIASPDAGSFPFRLGLSAATGDDFPVVFTAAGSDISQPLIPISSTMAYKVKEDIPANWAIDTPAPACTGASGSGNSNGTFNGTDTITGINAGPDQVITCTFRDKQLTGAIKITKQRTGTTTGLSGAHFTIDGAGDHVTGSDGTVCKDGLAFGTYSVNETQAPNGHGLDPNTPKSVVVDSAGTCASGAENVTFNNAVVPGTINIHKTDDAGQALGGATFTLYHDNPTVGGSRQANDVATDPALTCTTVAVTGNCSIANVPLGDYWIVETGVPDGYTGAADKAVNVGVGPTPGAGDTDSVSFENTPAAGSISILKKGRNGLPLPGAEFTLYKRNPLEEEHSPGFSTSKVCTSDSSGVCFIDDVDPGDYWLVETGTPAGYATVDDVSVTVGLGEEAGEGEAVELTINDPVVPGTIEIHKTGVGGSSLSGAQLTLYVDNAPVGGSRGGEDTITQLKCTTAAQTGDCTIANVPLGNYWVVETITPNGYDTAPEQTVVVGLGPAANTGDTDELTFHDPVVPGTVSITKTDDANNVLEGAEFTLYDDAAPVGGTFDAEDDTVTSPALKCETAANGKCDITDVPLGDYWIVETKTPENYDTAAPKPVTIGLGGAPKTGDTESASFVNPRRHRVLVVVCHEGTDSLLSSDVTVGGVTKQSVDGSQLSAAEEKELCDTGGASFGDISGHGNVNAAVDIGGAGN